MPRTCQGHPRRQADGIELSQPQRVATCVPDGRAGGFGPRRTSGTKMVLTGAPSSLMGTKGQQGLVYPLLGFSLALLWSFFTVSPGVPLCAGNV